MTKQVSGESLLLSVRVQCSKCEQRSTLKPSAVDVRASEIPCDLCGSHGHSELTFTCPKCKTYNSITVTTW